MKNLLLLNTLILITQIGLSQPKAKAQASNSIVLQNVGIVDMLSSRAKVGNIIIEGERIATIDYSQSEAFPAASIIYDCTGKYVMPGLIDNHVHITHGTLKEAKEHLEIALKNGVTAVRDMGRVDQFFIFIVC